MRAIVELDHVRSAVACELRRGFCNDELRPEFLCLRVGSVCKLLSGNSGRKAEIILDFRTRPGLAAGGVHFDYHDVKPFRRTVDGCRQSRWPGADYGDITYMRLVDGVVESETASNLAVGGIPQHDRPAANQHRDIVHTYMESVEQFLSAGVLIEVDCCYTDVGFASGIP